MYFFIFFFVIFVTTLKINHEKVHHKVRTLGEFNIFMQFREYNSENRTKTSQCNVFFIPQTGECYIYFAFYNKKSRTLYSVYQKYLLHTYYLFNQTFSHICIYLNLLHFMKLYNKLANYLLMLTFLACFNTLFNYLKNTEDTLKRSFLTQG